MFASLRNFKGIIVTNDNIKTNILNYFFERKELISFSFKSINELNDMVLGCYDIDAYLALGKKHKYEICDILFRNSLLVNSENSFKKAKELNEIKNNYITLDMPFFENNIFSNNLLLLNYYYDNDVFNKTINILKEKNYIINNYFLNKYMESKNIEITCYKTQKDEVFNTLKKISKLIYNGVRPKDIYLCYKNKDYENLLKEVFKLYNIPVNFNKKNKLSEYKIVLKLYEDLQENKELLLRDYVIDNSILKSDIGKYVISIFNKFVLKDYYIKDILDYILYLFNNTYVNVNSLNLNDFNENSVNIVNDYKGYFDENKHLFIIGLNQNIIPSIHKNDDYLSDEEKIECGLITSTEKNRYERQALIDLVSVTRNVNLSYANSSSSGKLMPSSVIEDLKESFNITILNTIQDYNISYSKRASCLEFNRFYDDFIKYNTLTDDLKILNNHFEYRKYLSNNDVKKDGKIADILDKGMVLSYTSISEYYNCPFAFYLNRVLKVHSINILDANLNALNLGNLFHYVLYKAFLTNISIDDSIINNHFKKLIDEYYNESKIEISSKQKVFNDIYLFYLVNVYKYIRKTMNVSSFKITSLESEYRVKEKHDYVVVGKIDKVLNGEVDGERYAVVIDYKTGLSTINLNNVIYGLDMQLLFYFYFLNHHEKVKFAGGYLSHVLPSSILSFDSKKTYQEQLEDLYRFDGYTNNNLKVIKSLDDDCFDKSYLKGIAFKKDSNDLTQNAVKRTIDDNQYEMLLKIVYQKIEVAIDNIYTGIFPIKPIQIGDKKACDMCGYKDICYVSNESVHKVKTYKDLSFLKEGGEV